MLIAIILFGQTRISVLFLVLLVSVPGQKSFRTVSAFDGAVSVLCQVSLQRRLIRAHFSTNVAQKRISMGCAHMRRQIRFRFYQYQLLASRGTDPEFKITKETSARLAFEIRFRDHLRNWWHIVELNLILHLFGKWLCTRFHHNNIDWLTFVSLLVRRRLIAGDLDNIRNYQSIDADGLLPQYTIARYTFRLKIDATPQISGTIDANELRQLDDGSVGVDHVLIEMNARECVKSIYNARRFVQHFVQPLQIVILAQTAATDFCRNRGSHWLAFRSIFSETNSMLL